MQIIELTVTLRYMAPKVTRTLEVHADTPLDQLHETLQAAFGWDTAHLYQFCIGEPYQWGAERWVTSDFVDGPEDLPADQTTLAKALAKAGKADMTYLYDFGDDWEHVIKADAPKPAAPNQAYPNLTKIKGTCPPEDIGGPPGFEMFKKAMTDPKHPEHKELKTWYGGVFNPQNPDEKTLKANVTKLAKQWQK